ncbi:cupin domain-containing protein [Haloarchaeobius sp. TZWSO28]|uniref:cupin domain-containing protein n=1 Tax=Haloarchaeobius sp. TZWSO28 TaxID=3446119 RepID=UPI003EC1264B
MNHVALEGVTDDRIGDESERRRLTGPLGTTDLALSHYRLAPGDGFPGGLHAHTDQAEVFVVLAGVATFETPDAPGGEVTVSAGEAIRFGPGEFQTGWNRGDTDCVALALGAPRDTEDTRIPVACPDCGHGDLRLDVAGDTPTLVCPDCDAAHIPEPCPTCGDGELLARLGPDAEPIAVCETCGDEFATPPLG